MNSLFEIGQKVVCVKSDPPSQFPNIPTYLVEGKVYTVLGIAKSECCGTIVIDVGLKRPSQSSTRCGCGGVDYKLVGWKYQTRFVPLEFDRQADEAIHEALKGQKTLTNY